MPPALDARDRRPVRLPPFCKPLLSHAVYPHVEESETCGRILQILKAFHGYQVQCLIDIYSTQPSASERSVSFSVLVHP